MLHGFGRLTALLQMVDRHAELAHTDDASRREVHLDGARYLVGEALSIVNKIQLGHIVDEKVQELREAAE